MTVMMSLCCRKQEMLTISNVPLADCPPSPPRTAPPTMKVSSTSALRACYESALKEDLFRDLTAAKRHGVKPPDNIS